LSTTYAAASLVQVTAASHHDAAPALGFDTPIEATGGFGFTGGVDPQSVEELRAVIAGYIQNPSYGTADAYRRWAMAVPGVDDAKAVGVIAGVYIYPIKADETDFSQAELNEIQAYIQTLCPAHIKAAIMVFNPPKTILYAAAQLILADGVVLADVEDSIIESMSSYVQTLDIGDTSVEVPPEVRINKLVEAALSIDGVEDVLSMAVDDVGAPTSTTNFQIPDDYVVQLPVANITLSV
jgi:uncharacterized phage protein gp47/JayE